MTRIAPYGSWESPITIDMLTAGSVGLGSATIDDGTLLWTESRADQGGRVSLWAQRRDGTRTELTPDHHVGSMVHEYGGTAYAAGHGIVVFSSLPTHQCFVISGGQTRPLTPADGTLRYIGFEIHPERNLVLAVREDHRASDLDCVNTVVALRLDSDNPDGGTIVCQGADFYASPTLSADGRLAWVEWHHPHMPWDSARLLTAPMTDDLALGATTLVAGTDASAPCYPTWQGRDLLYLDDVCGFWNVYRRTPNGETACLTGEDQHDWCYPHWVFTSSLHPLADGRVVAARYVDGTQELYLISPHGNRERLDSAGVGFTVGGDDAQLAVVVDYRDRPTTLERYDLTTGRWSIERRCAELDLDPAWFSLAQPRSWNSDLGVVHGWYYPPTNPEFAAPAGELPPLKVLSHGGPTGLATAELNLKKQYWTSRGWGILDVNYGGSAGYGRAYRNRLQGRWGVLDVNDCADGAAAIIAAGLADPARIAIEGGSAGGFTTLAALTTTDTFKAGHCLYGIGDLTILVTDTHKFESRYLDGLLGGTPEEVPHIYRERSPINHLDRLSCPMLIQQGADDRVVPANQATLMADAVRAKGLPVALILFEGEGHGFRRSETIRASTQAAESFFGQVFGYEPIGVPHLEVDNLHP